MRCVSVSGAQTGNRPLGSLDLIEPDRRSTPELTTNVLVTFYSAYGHVHRMALAVAEGAESVPDSAVQLAGSRSSKRRARRYQPRTLMCGRSRHRPTFLWSPMTICAGPTASPGGRRPATAT